MGDTVKLPVPIEKIVEQVLGLDFEGDVIEEQPGEQILAGLVAADLLQQDLYILNYVVSELIGDHAKFQKLMNLAAASAPAGGMFLIVDRDQDKVIQNATALLSTAGLDGKAKAAIAACRDRCLGWYSANRVFAAPGRDRRVRSGDAGQTAAGPPAA